MSRLPAPSPVPDEALPLLEAGEALMGFRSRDAEVMAHSPKLLRAVSELVGAVYGPGGLKRLVGHVSSTAAGCRYCMAHTANGAGGAGVEHERVAAAWEYEASPLFTDAERAALRIAHLGSLAPCAVEDGHVEELRSHFSPKACAEIVAVVAVFGFLNRWNGILDTELEPVPRAFAEAVG